MSSLKRATDPARAAADRYVRSGVRSTQELRAYLTARHVSAGAAERLIRDYERRGVVDDRACARLWAEQWARQGYAWAVIQDRLAAKGLSSDAIDDAAKRVGHPSAERARARELAARRLRGRSRLAWSRLARTLASRGFDPELIDEVLRETLGQESASPPPAACAGPSREQRKERGGRRTDAKKYGDDE